MNGSGGRSCALFILLLCLAMMSTAAHGRTLRGAVKSASDSTAVAGADCTLSFGGTVVGSTRTDAAGAFSLATQVRGKARLEVAKEGFNPTYILIDAASATSDLGTIYLNEATMLGEVTVSTQAVRNSDGRTIVFPSSADVNASHTSLSLFAKLPLPGLQTNPINRSLTVDGGSPMILIDGVPSTLDDVNALSPANIAKVEFSRLTPVRYADKGYSGLLSITLKQRVDGGEVYLWARSALNTTFVDANLRASYHQGPSQFTFFYIPSWRNYQDVHDYSLESYVAPDFRIRLESSDRNPFNYNTNSIYLKYNYKPMPRRSFRPHSVSTPTPTAAGRSAQPQIRVRVSMSLISTVEAAPCRLRSTSSSGAISTATTRWSFRWWARSVRTSICATIHLSIPTGAAKIMWWTSRAAAVR